MKGKIKYLNSWLIVELVISLIVIIGCSKYVAYILNDVLPNVGGYLNRLPDVVFNLLLGAVLLLIVYIFRTITIMLVISGNKENQSIKSPKSSKSTTESQLRTNLPHKEKPVENDITFKCKSCSETIITKFLKPGELAKCKKCGEQNIVPE